MLSHMVKEVLIGLLTLAVGMALTSRAEAWCQKGTTLNGLNERFPGNHGPDLVVRVDRSQLIQDAIDTATDLNDDGYIIIGAVNGGNGEPYGHVRQRVLVDHVYPLPFGLFGCSLTIHDPNPSDGLPTAHITAGAASPDLFVMDLHASSSLVAGWLLEGNGRYLRNAYAKENAIGYWLIGEHHTLHNGAGDDNREVGILAEGNGHTIINTKFTGNGRHGIQVIGDHHRILKNTVGERGRGNNGDGIRLSGAGNLLAENRVYANGGDGIVVSGGNAANPNIIRKNLVGEKARGNGGNGIVFHTGVGNGRADPVELEQNTVRANGLNGILLADTATGHELKGNNNGGKTDFDNRDCEFLVAVGNINATGNKANELTIPGRDGDPFPTGCLGTP